MVDNNNVTRDIFRCPFYDFYDSNELGKIESFISMRVSSSARSIEGTPPSTSPLRAFLAGFRWRSAKNIDFGEISQFFELPGTAGDSLAGVIQERPLDGEREAERRSNFTASLLLVQIRFLSRSTTNHKRGVKWRDGAMEKLKPIDGTDWKKNNIAGNL